MIVPAAIATVVGVLALVHRSLGPLADIRFRAPGLVFAALGTQVVLLHVLPEAVPRPLSVIGHLVSYGLALAFVVHNRRWTGLVILGAGGALNFGVIIVNGGTMPASEQAVDAAGIDHDGSFQNSSPLDDPVLAPLGDVFAVPEPLPLANVFSAGDVLVVVGAGVLAGGAYRRGVDVTDSPSAGATGVSPRTS